MYIYIYISERERDNEAAALAGTGPETSAPLCTAQGEAHPLAQTSACSGPTPSSRESARNRATDSRTRPS